MIRHMTLDDYDRVYALWPRTAGMGLRDGRGFYGNLSYSNIRTTQ